MQKSAHFSFKISIHIWHCKNSTNFKFDYVYKNNIDICIVVKQIYKKYIT